MSGSVLTSTITKETEPRQKEEQRMGRWGQRREGFSIGKRISNIRTKGINRKTKYTFIGNNHK